MRISKLYKVDDRIVFYAKDLQQIRNEFYTKILSGEATCLDAYGKVMDPDEAAEDFLLMADFYVPENYEEQIMRNMKVAGAFICIVRVEMLNASVGPEYMAMFHDADFALRCGAFDTAQKLVEAFPEDEFITAELKLRWREMLLVSDAIIYP
jgi:hypothetical protein